MSPKTIKVAVGDVSHSIHTLRGHKVLLDVDLAALYGVDTKVLVQAVKRNLVRFPNDFMFLLTRQELAILRSQIVTSSWGGRRSAPYAFTEQGVAMLSSVLRSERAVAVNIEIMRAFVRLRRLVSIDSALAQKLEHLEARLSVHDVNLTMHTESIAGILSAISELIAPTHKENKKFPRQ